MTTKIRNLIIAVAFVLAAFATISRTGERATISQNPLPACPPFCDPDPNTGPDTTR